MDGFTKGTQIRQAVPQDAAVISALALRSKGHWGYDEAFLEACREELTLTPDYIESHPVFVFETGGDIAGFYAISGSPPVGELRDLFVEPIFIGRGVGRKLWDHAMELARGEGFEALLIDADPNAESFYAARGAVRVGESPSGSIPGRMLPQMRVDLL